MKVLIVKLSALGDVIQALPVLSALKEAGHQVHWVVEEAAQEILNRHPLLDRLLVFPRKTWFKTLGKRPRETLREIRDFVSLLRAERYDLVVDLQGLLKSALVVAFSKGERKMGFSNHREGSPMSYNFPLSPYDPDEHAVWRYLRPLSLLGLKVKRPRFLLPPLPEGLPSSLGLPDRYAVLIPGARWETKLWEPAHWAVLACALSKMGLFPVFCGGVSEKAYVEQILTRSGTGLSLCGKTSLLELAALLKAAKVIVSVDTGPMHLAVAAGKQVVALFGPTAPWRTGPFGEGHVVLRKDLPCSPCFRRRCPEKLCLKTLEPEEVIQAIKDGRIHSSV